MKDPKKVKDGAKCMVIGGVHKGKSGVVRDINKSKTGQITITVIEENDEKFKTLAKNIVVLKYLTENSVDQIKIQSNIYLEFHRFAHSNQVLA